ncbi:Uncharacterised protein [Shewanella baltica]|nr:Uncharacterised protein [Shewanella baltica]
MYIGVGSVVMQSWDGKPKACHPIELLLQAIYHQLSATRSIYHKLTISLDVTRTAHPL